MRSDIRDRAHLAQLVGELVQRLGDGSQEKAAQQIDLSRAMLSFLSRGQRDRIDSETVEKLRKGIILAVRAIRHAEGPAKALAEHERLEGLLHAAVPRPDTGAREHAFEEWCVERAERLMRIDSERRRRRSSDGSVIVVPARAQLEEPQPPLVQSAGLLTRQVEADRKAAIENAIRTIENGSTEDLMKHFRGFCEQRRIPEERQMVAKVRIVEPLLESGESGFVERDISELTDIELRKCVRAGIAIEMVLLSRVGVEVRAAAPPPPGVL